MYSRVATKRNLFVGAARFLHLPGAELHLDNLKLRSVSARTNDFLSPYDLEIETAAAGMGDAGKMPSVDGAEAIELTCIFPLFALGGVLYASAYFNTDVLSSETVERVWLHYLTLIGHIAERRDLNARIVYLPVLPFAERYARIPGSCWPN